MSLAPAKQVWGYALLVMPMQVQDLDRSVDDLETRLVRVHKASCKYREALHFLCASQSEFANALLDCRTPGNDDNALKGKQPLPEKMNAVH